MNQYTVILNDIWTDLQDLEKHQPTNAEIVVYMSRGLFYACVGCLRTYVFYHGPERPYTIFGRDIIPTDEQGWAYSVTVRRRLDSLKEAGAEATP